jgi:hypothetical protein
MLQMLSFLPQQNTNLTVRAQRVGNLEDELASFIAVSMEKLLWGY